MNSFKQVSGMLAQRAEDVARYLLPNGKKVNGYYCCGDVYGTPGDSLRIYLSGDKAGRWRDYATDGERNYDLLDMWSFSRRIPLKEALKEASQYMGIAQPKFEAYRPKIYSRPTTKKVGIDNQSPVMKYLIEERKLARTTLEEFKVGEQANTIVFNFIREGEVILEKYLSLDRPGGKKQIRVSPDCEPCLFGWQVFPQEARTVAIIEGEIDCMSAYQYGIPALSVPFGAGKGKKHEWLEYEFDRLSVFDEIFLCFDPDAAGQGAIAELVERLGRHRCRVVELPFKDLNECLQQSVSAEEIQKCFKEARTLDPEELKSASEFVDQVIDEFYPKEGAILGYKLPWESAKRKILFRSDELVIWTGINGHGKSQVLGHVMLQAMKDGARVCVASLEIKPKKLLMRLTRQAAGTEKPPEDYIRAIHSWYEDKLWLFDLVGTTKAERLLEVFQYARQRYGIDIFVIDSFMKCGIDEEDFRSQKAFIDKLCDFKNKYNCQIHLVTHPRKSDDEDHIIGKLDVKGSGSITDLADYCFVVWRNKKKEGLRQKQANGESLKPEQLKILEKPDCFLRCDKNRNGDWEGLIALWFDRESYQYLGKPDTKPKSYVEYSALQAASF